MKPYPDADQPPCTPTAHSTPCRGRGLWPALLWTVCLALTPALVEAQPNPAPAAGSPEDAERDKRARGLFETGRQAYQDGRYRDAWAAFHEAYQLSGRPELLYNIGQTADRLGQDADALRAFRMYVERLPNAPNRRDVENRVRALEDRVSMSARSSPETTPETQAEPATPTPEAAAAHAREGSAPPPPAAPGKTLHPQRRGLYLRAAFGLGYNTVAASETSRDVDASVDGSGLLVDLAAGYGVLPGFVVGGILTFDPFLGPTLTMGDQERDLESANLFRVGPFVDWYLKRETAGWHVQGSITLTIFGMRLSGTRDSVSGVGLNLGGGYEFPIAGDFAIGVMARIAVDFLAEETASYTALTPALLATLTWF